MKLLEDTTLLHVDMFVNDHIVVDWLSVSTTKETSQLYAVATIRRVRRDLRSKIRSEY